MKYFIAILIILFGTTATVLAQGTLDFAGHVPEEGKPLVLCLKDADPLDATLTVIYRPNSATEKVDDSGPFPLDAEGRVQWVPQSPGIATLAVLDREGKTVAQSDVAIRFAEVPLAGIVVMVLAGLLLFGGAGYSLVLALRKEVDTD